MRYLAALFLLPVLALQSISAEIIASPFELEEFDVDIFQFPYMELIDNPASEQFSAHYTFTNKKKDYQVRYSFLKQTQPKIETPKTFYAIAVLPIIWNVAGFETDQISQFTDSDVKKEFNGDFGTTVFIIEPKSDFCTGYKFILLNFYYKAEQGIVVQSLLFNDLNFAATEEFIEIFHSFKFHE